MPPGSGLDTDFNYVRNSVKATVDAYDGTMHFYVVDPTDPIIQTYRKAFPDLFDDCQQMPEGLQDHFRYPDDIFDAQTEQYTLYHMTDALQFFQKADCGTSRRAPGTSDATSSSTVPPPNGQNGGRNTTLASSGNPIDPLYQMMQTTRRQRAGVRAATSVRAPRRRSTSSRRSCSPAIDRDNYGKLDALPGTGQFRRAVAVPAPRR